MIARGGPFAYRELAAHTDKVIIEGYPGMAYHRTRPTDTDWRERMDQGWWMKGLPEPVPPDYVYEWHEEEWVSPEVAMIRRAYTEAARKAERKRREWERRTAGRIR